MRILIRVLTLIFPLAAHATTTGTYAVPVPAELTPYAIFPLAAMQVHADSTNLALEYDLPVELSGSTILHFSLAGTRQESGNFKVKGKAQQGTLAFGDCKQQTPALTCSISYGNMPFTSKEVHAFVASKFFDNPDLALKIEAVGDLFSTDPHGIVSITFDESLPQK